jgi:uncharacterized protein (AIM24 family)
MQSHKVDYELIGDDMQIVEVGLDPGEGVVAEAGAMNYMGEGIQFEAKMGDGSRPKSGIFGKLLGAGQRLLTGESVFMTHFTNAGSDKQRVAFSAPYPGKIIPIELASIGGELICQKDAFFYVRRWASRSGLRFTSGWGPAFSGARVSFYSACAEMGWRFCMSAARRSKKHFTMKRCGWIRDVLSASRPGLITTSNAPVA